MSANKCTLLVVDDELYILPTLTYLLAPYFDVVTADSVDAAQQVFSQRPIDVILTDQKMPRRTGVQLLEWVREHYPRTVRLLMTGYTDLEDAINAINRGHVYAYLLKPWRNEELLQTLRNAAEKSMLERNQDELLEKLRRLNQDLEKRVAERTRELEEANHLLQQRALELQRLALTDPLTGLFNRRAVEESALFELKRHARYHSPITIGLVDLDKFKDINTNYTHVGGDEAIKGLAKLLTGTLREVDSVGRWGGDEFLIIARETNEEGARHLAERIRATVAQAAIPYKGEIIKITVTLSLVVAEASVPTTFDEMFEVCDKNLMDAKKLEQRNQVFIRRLEEADKTLPAALASVPGRPR